MMEFKFDIENLPEPAVLVKMLKGLGWTDHEIARKTKSRNQPSPDLRTACVRT
jgi:hypothetical protein